MVARLDEPLPSPVRSSTTKIRITVGFRKVSFFLIYPPKFAPICPMYPANPTIKRGRHEFFQRNSFRAEQKLSFGLKCFGKRIHPGKKSPRPSALYFERHYIFPRTEHEIHLLVSFQPIKYLDFGSAYAIDQIGPHGRLYQPAPIFPVPSGRFESVRAGGGHKRRIQHLQFRARGSLFHLPSRIFRQPRNQSGPFEQVQVMGQGRRIANILELANHLSLGAGQFQF